MRIIETTQVNQMSQGGGWLMTDQGGDREMRELSEAGELTGHGGS